MIDINSAAARLRLREDWKTVTLKAFDTAPPSVADLICEQQDSKAAVNVYDLVVQLPVMRRFVDQVVIQPTGRAQHRITNEELEATISVPQASIERGEAAQFNNKFEMLLFHLGEASGSRQRKARDGRGAFPHRGTLGAMP